jgi:hypothetical protein
MECKIERSIARAVLFQGCTNASVRCRVCLEGRRRQSHTPRPRICGADKIRSPHRQRHPYNGIALGVDCVALFQTRSDARPGVLAAFSPTSICRRNHRVGVACRSSNSERKALRRHRRAERPHQGGGRPNGRRRQGSRSGDDEAVNAAVRRRFVTFGSGAPVTTA